MPRTVVLIVTERWQAIRERKLSQDPSYCRAAMLSFQEAL
jgi:hypothetical protein